MENFKANTSINRHSGPRFAQGTIVLVDMKDVPISVRVKAVGSEYDQSASFQAKVTLSAVASGREIEISTDIHGVTRCDKVLEGLLEDISPVFVEKILVPFLDRICLAIVRPMPDLVHGESAKEVMRQLTHGCYAPALYGTHDPEFPGLMDSAERPVHAVKEVETM